MENHRIESDQKLTSILQHFPQGMVIIDRSGKVMHENAIAKELVPLALNGGSKGSTDFFSRLDPIAPQLVKNITRNERPSGQFIRNELYCFSQQAGEKLIERQFRFNVTFLPGQEFLILIEDLTDKSLQEKILTQAILDRTVAQEKFDIATNVLHDIGNAVVGFGSYLNRIKRTLEENNAETLQQLTLFFESHTEAMAAGIGEAKAGAVLTMLNSVTENQGTQHAAIRKSITEQHNIINHIQEILNIQRQYMNGNGIQETKPTRLRNIINDCMSMLFASIEKRGIHLSLNVPTELPLITCNRTRMMQVILNVLKNSIEAIDIHSSQKSISINVFTHEAFLILQVHDSGQGFDEATGKLVFERGFTTKSSGNGLGLHSCRTIIESFDGTIEIASEGPGKGALTTISFKIEPAAQELPIE